MKASSLLINMKRENYFSDSPWEKMYGYSRAVKIGNQIFVSGTTGTDAEGKVVSNEPYGQTKFCIQKIQKVLEDLDSSLKDVYRIRLYLTDLSVTQKISKLIQNFFPQFRQLQHY